MSALGQKQTFAVQKAMSALPPIADIVRCDANVCFVPIADMATLRLHLGTYRTLHFRECLFARVFVTSAIGGARTQHGLSDSRNRFSRHLAKFFLGSTD